MDLKNGLSKIEHTLGENKYELLVPSTAPLGEIHDVLYFMRNFIVTKMQEAIKSEVQEVRHDDEIVETPS